MWDSRAKDEHRVVYNGSFGEDSGCSDGDSGSGALTLCKGAIPRSIKFV